MGKVIEFLLEGRVKVNFVCEIIDRGEWKVDANHISLTRNYPKMFDSLLEVS